MREYRNLKRRKSSFYFTTEKHVFFPTHCLMQGITLKLPNKRLGLTLSPAEVEVSVSWHFCVPFFLQAVNALFGDHAVSSSSAGKEVVQHNNLRNLVFKAFNCAYHYLMPEPKNWSSIDGRRPGVLFFLRDLVLLFSLYLTQSAHFCRRFIFHKQQIYAGDSFKSRGKK